MRIAEIYESTQGEGSLTGLRSVFVRASGCNLRCWFCDTPYTSWAPKGEDLSVDEVLRRIGGFDCQHVVITGGEPMLFAELIPICEQLNKADKHITIETAGTLYLPLCCDLMSVSPKLSNSAPAESDAAKWRERHEKTRHAPQVIRRLLAEYECQFKFVIDDPADCDEVLRYLEDFPEIAREQVLLMPQGTEQSQLIATSSWLEPYCQVHRYQFCPRKHIEWFGLTRGT